MPDESYRYNAAHREYVNSQMTQVAKALLAAEIGVIEAARALSPFRSDVERTAPEIAKTLLSFTVIDSETDTLPVGEVRKHWDPLALAPLDRKIAAAEDLYRETARTAAARLIEQIDDYRSSTERSE